MAQPGSRVKPPFKRLTSAFGLDSRVTRPHLKACPALNHFFVWLWFLRTEVLDLEAK